MLRNLTIASILLTLSCEKSIPMTEIAPTPKKIPYELTAHGYTRIDNYYWLRDDTRSKPEVIEYLKEENSYADAWFEARTSYKNEMVDELLNKLPNSEISFPYQNGTYRYFSIQYKDKQLPIYYRSLNQDNELILDPNIKFSEYEYYNVAGTNPSPDNSLLAFAEDTNGRREYVVKFLNIEQQKLLADELTLTTGNIIWLDSQTILYLQKDPTTLIANKIYLHKLGDAQETDQLIYEESDPEFNMNLYQSIDKSVAFINIESTNSNEIRFFSINAKELKLIMPREENHLYYVDTSNNDLYIRSNKGAPNFALYKTSIETVEDYLSPENLILKHNENIFIEDMQPYNKIVGLSIRTNGLPEIAILRHGSENLEVIEQSEQSYTTALLPPRYQNGDGSFFFEYSSLITPSEILEIDYGLTRREIVWKKEVRGFKPEEYETFRRFVVARDGTEIPVSIVKKKTTPNDSPILFYGYGSYGINTEASFRRAPYPLIDRGFIYAMVNIRGGGEMGKHWYDGGRMQNKMNTFYDFNDSVHAILSSGLGDKSNVFAQGGSAGGLLMGAIINLEPNLYKGILSGVPFVDVLTTMSDASIPLTTFEYDEWGNPAIKEEYEYMSKYSPYDNIAPLPYPAVLVTSSLYDSQVQYFEPAKYVPKLREFSTSNNPILLKMNLSGGHGGKSGIINGFEEAAEEYNFLLNLVN